MGRKKRLLMFLGTVALSPLVIILILWLWIIFSQDPYNNPLAKSGAWPVACSLRGCITTGAWHKQSEARTLFAKTLNQDLPSPEETLTTLIRQHLVNESFVHSPVTVRDAVRYREEILRARDEAKILGSTGLSISDYDRLVILPLLQQEVLREERNVTDFDSLFKQLAQERLVWVLPTMLKWHKDEALVMSSP